MKSLAVLAALSMSCFAACQSDKVDRTGKSTEGFYVPSFATLWERVNTEMRESGYPPDIEASSQESRTIVSRYNTQLSPFTAKGTREQATVTIHPVPGRDNYWSVEANVVRELNMNQKEPGNARKAEWKGGERVREAETQLVHRIETFFIGYELSPQFRNRYGYGGGRETIPGYVNPDSPEGQAAAEKAKQAK